MDTFKRKLNTVMSFCCLTVLIIGLGMNPVSVYAMDGNDVPLDLFELESNSNADDDSSILVEGTLVDTNNNSEDWARLFGICFYEECDDIILSTGFAGPPPDPPE